MKYSKKSAIEVQFNWLFVLLIGAVLLIFVFSVIRTQTEVVEYDISATVRMNLDSVLQDASQTPGTTFTVQLRNTRFTSSDSCVDSFYLNDNRNLRIEMEAVFSPKQMDSVRGEFLLWVLPWDMPFRITNFVYLTSPDIIYLLVYDGFTEDFVKEINSSRTTLSLPEDLTKIIIEDNAALESQLKQLDHLNTRVIYIKNDCSTTVFPDHATSAVCIQVNDNVESGGLNGWGNVTYLDPEDNHKHTFFIGRPSLFGVIFAEDIVQYDCSMQKAFKRMLQLLDVYQYRSSNLSQTGDMCGTRHDQAVGRLTAMKNAIRTNNKIGETLYNNSIKGTASLRGLNQDTKLRSCVYIY